MSMKTDAQKRKYSGLFHLRGSFITDALEGNIAYWLRFSSGD